MPLKKSLIKIIKILGVGISVLYPFIVFFALKKHIALRAVALLLLAIAGVSTMRNKQIWMFVAVLFLCLGLIIFNQGIFLKLYPLSMNLGVCLMFALSLHNTPLIEKFAIKMGYTMDDAARKYAKRATVAWAIFMGALAIISGVTVFLSDEIWVLFNGLISYVLIAIMMGVEFFVRKRVARVNRHK